MTRADVLARLLQHGPLTRAEIKTLTGWRINVVAHAIEALRKGAEIRRIEVQGEGRYCLTDIARVPSLTNEVKVTA